MRLMKTRRLIFIEVFMAVSPVTLQQFRLRAQLSQSFSSVNQPAVKKKFKKLQIYFVRKNRAGRPTASLSKTKELEKVCAGM